MACPGENAVLDFVEGALRGPAGEEFHVHLDSCTGCQRLVAELARADETLVTPPAGAPRALQRGDTLDRYLVLDQLGVGGMGVVYAAFDPQLDRKVALKLLRPDVQGAFPREQGARLLGEAQALARLSHPNVVTVYEARALDEQLCVVMELVDGATLAHWLASRSRPWREVLEVFLKAGQGLWAAHEAGIIHRDFKPANVLIGKDGRVRVTDFGLARLQGGGHPEPPKPPGAQQPEDGRSVGGTSVTRTGEVLGTPAYMAPEQWDGKASDARTDQFSFCVALYEGLYGVRPFPGEGLKDLAAAVKRGEVAPAPRGARVPARVRRVLLQGLRGNPAERFPSMRELLAALSHDPFSAWRAPLAAMAGLVLIGVGAILGGRHMDAGAQLCRGGERKLAGIWDEERKPQVREALLAAGTPYAQDAWRGVEHALDGYTHAWISMHTEACEATRVRGERSEALLDLQVTCLERRARDLQALTDLFVRTRGQAVENAVQAAYALPPLKECAETDALAAQVKRPRDPAQLARVEQVDHQLSEVRALVSAGKNAIALEMAEDTAALARDVQHPPTSAEAFYQLGLLRMRNGEAPPAEEALSEAAWAATAGHHDRLAARARIDLVQVLSELAARPTEAGVALREAEAALARFGADPDMESSLESVRAGVLTAQDRCEEALPHLKRALALADQSYDREDPRRARILDNLGKALRCVGDLEGARARLQEAVALRERTFGSEHPEVALSLNQLANVFFDRGEYEQSLAHHQRALAIRERTLGPGTVVVADSLVNVGADLITLKREAEGRDHLRRALTIYEGVFGPDSPRLAQTLINLGHVEVDLGAPGEAVRLLERGLKILQGRDDDLVAILRFNLARALRGARGDPQRARLLAIEARHHFERRRDARQRVLEEINTWLDERSSTL